MGSLGALFGCMIGSIVLFCIHCGRNCNLHIYHMHKFSCWQVAFSDGPLSCTINWMRLKHECLFAVFCYYAKPIDWINFQSFSCLRKSLTIVFICYSIAIWIYLSVHLDTIMPVQLTGSTCSLSVAYESHLVFKCV